jgi:TolB protein
MIATWSPFTPQEPGAQPAPGDVDPATATTTLYLVDPTGNRYAITTFTPAEISHLYLVDWSGDGSHALFTEKYSQPARAISVDLHTGAKTTIPVTGLPRYTRPNGKAILMSTDDNGSVAGTLKRIDLAGNEQLTYPTDKLGDAGQFKGGYLESPDGTQLVLEASNGMVVMGNDGKVIRQLTSPLPKGGCWPARWWTPTVVLAECTVESSSSNQLWEVPLSGSGATALTALNSGQGHDPGFDGDLGDWVAWKLPSGTFLQSLGACGTQFLSRLTSDMHTTRVQVPGVSDSVHVTGVSGDDLVLLAKVGCGGTTSLLTYDPAANTSTVLLGPPLNGGGVSDALLYPERP